jgi:formate dehydrogenase subunit delta
MDTENLVKMANNISNFFVAEPDEQVAIDGVANHIKRFWELRMRVAIITHYKVGGEGLSAIAKAAVARLALEQDKLVNAGNG